MRMGKRDKRYRKGEEDERGKQQMWRGKDQRMVDEDEASLHTASPAALNYSTQTGHSSCVFIQLRRDGCTVSPRGISPLHTVLALLTDAVI